MADAWRRIGIRTRLFDDTADGVAYSPGSTSTQYGDELPWTDYNIALGLGGGAGAGAGAGAGDAQASLQANNALGEWEVKMTAACSGLNWGAVLALGKHALQTYAWTSRAVDTLLRTVTIHTTPATAVTVVQEVISPLMAFLGRLRLLQPGFLPKVRVPAKFLKQLAASGRFDLMHMCLFVHCEAAATHSMILGALQSDGDIVELISLIVYNSEEDYTTFISKVAVIFRRLLRHAVSGTELGLLFARGAAARWPATAPKAPMFLPQILRQMWTAIPSATDPAARAQLFSVLTQRDPHMFIPAATLFVSHAFKTGNVGMLHAVAIMLPHVTQGVQVAAVATNPGVEMMLHESAGQLHRLEWQKLWATAASVEGLITFVQAHISAPHFDAPLEHAPSAADESKTSATGGASATMPKTEWTPETVFMLMLASARPIGIEWSDSAQQVWKMLTSADIFDPDRISHAVTLVCRCESIFSAREACNS